MENTTHISWNQTLQLINETETKMRQPRGGCETFEFVIYTLLVGAICIMGVFGNTVSIIALRYDRRHVVPALLLQALAVADNFLLVLSFPAISIMGGLLPFTKQHDVLYLLMPYVLKYINPVAYMAMTQTILSTCLLAINRYIATCKVMQSWKLCTLRRARIQIAAITAFSILFNFPRFFQVNIVTINNKPVPIPTSIGHKSLFAAVYTTALFSILVFLVPLVLLIVINMKIIRVIREAWRSRRRMSKSKDTPDRANENNITKVMVVIICVFVICHAPDRLYYILKFFSKRKCGTALFYYHALCNVLVVFNSSCNFMIYCIFRNRFKQVVIGIFCGCFKPRFKLQRMFSNTEQQDQRSGGSLRTQISVRSFSKGTSDDCMDSAFH